MEKMSREEIDRDIERERNLWLLYENQKLTEEQKKLVEGIMVMKKI